MSAELSRAQRADTRRLVAERDGWPAGALDACVAIEEEYPCWLASWKSGGYRALLRGRAPRCELEAESAEELRERLEVVDPLLGAELVWRNRRADAAHERWPDGVLEECEHLDCLFPAWSVWWTMDGERGYRASLRRYDANVGELRAESAAALHEQLEAADAVRYACRTKGRAR